MAKPIGRLYFNGNCISGYIVIGQNQVIKFAAERAEMGTRWIYQSLEQQKKAAEQLKALSEALEN